MGQTRAQCHNKQQGCIFGFLYIYLFMYMITDLPILDDAVRGSRVRTITHPINSKNGVFFGLDNCRFFF